MIRTISGLIFVLMPLVAVKGESKARSWSGTGDMQMDTVRKFHPPGFIRTVIDGRVQHNSHKPKVFARFSNDGYNDLGSLDDEGFKLYRYRESWKAYTIFSPGPASGFEDACVADINQDGWNDIVLGGWSNKTIWAENPAGLGKSPYTTGWKIHVVDDRRFSHEVCSGDLDKDGKIDVVTTSGLYFQGKTPAEWSFVGIGRSGQGTFVANMLSNGDGYNDVIALCTEGKRNMVAWFENPGHTGKNPRKDPWIPRIIDPDPGGDSCNFEMTTMAFTAGDINGDGRMDLVCASQEKALGEEMISGRLAMAWFGMRLLGTRAQENGLNTWLIRPSVGSMRLPSNWPILMATVISILTLLNRTRVKAERIAVPVNSNWQFFIT